MTAPKEKGGAVYRIYDADDALLYIGSTGDVRLRISTHLGPSSTLPGSDALRARYARHEATFYSTLAEARAVEAAAIYAERPELNRKGTSRTPAADEGPMTLGRAIRDAAIRRGVSMCELAYRVELPVAALTRIIDGSVIRMSLVCDIAEVLQVRASDLFAAAEEAAA